MQSSGASLFSFFLSQLPRPGICDLYIDCLAPPIELKECVLKCAINTKYKLEDHIDSYQPDVSILFVRDEKENIASLKKYEYRNWHGTIEDKLELLHYYRKNWNFDYVINKKDFLTNQSKILNELKNLVRPDFYEFNYKKSEIVRLGNDWCKKEFGKKWNFGNIKPHHKDKVSICNGNYNAKKFFI
jgi:hypothetical protein